VIFIFTCQV